MASPVSPAPSRAATRARRFNDVTVIIRADTANELRALIEADYAAWTSPVRS
jgi:hypothetical protein